MKKKQINDVPAKMKELAELAEMTVMRLDQDKRGDE